MEDKIYYKDVEISFNKNDKNYLEPILPILTKPCKLCVGDMEIRPLDIPFIKTKEGIYLVHRTGNGKLLIRNIMSADVLYGCRKCNYAEVVRLEDKEFIEE